MAAIITGDTSPPMIWRISDATISSWKISRCSMVRCGACLGGLNGWLIRHALGSCSEVVTALGQDGFGQELHPRRPASVTPMIS